MTSPAETTSVIDLVMSKESAEGIKQMMQRKSVSLVGVGGANISTKLRLIEHSSQEAYKPNEGFNLRGGSAPPSFCCCIFKTSKNRHQLLS